MNETLYDPSGEFEPPKRLPRTKPASLAGLPGISIPCGYSAGLPVGLQLIGPHFGEGPLLNFAHVYQRETDWHMQLPAGLAGQGAK